MNEFEKRIESIKSIDFMELSTLSKIHMSSIICMQIDILNNNIELNNIKINQMIEELEYLFEEYYKKYYMIFEDFYYSYNDSKNSKSFFTYLFERPNNYLSQDDIKVKIIVLTDIMNIFENYKYLMEHITKDELEKILLNWYSKLN